MIAEDDESIRSSLAELLALWEVEPLIFEDGDQAWDWLDSVEREEYPHPLPEVALLDILMPGKLGYEIGRRMRGLAQTRSIPLLIMTASELTKYDKEQIQRSVYPEHLIPKPFRDIDELRSLIESTIAGKIPAIEMQPPNYPGIDHEDQSTALLQ
jgi:CheY-like chemotaxis protein